VKLVGHREILAMVLRPANAQVTTVSTSAWLYQPPQH
jgi:hypothetical protein